MAARYRLKLRRVALADTPLLQERHTRPLVTRSSAVLVVVVIMVVIVVVIMRMVDVNGAIAPVIVPPPAAGAERPRVRKETERAQPLAQCRLHSG